MSAVMIVEPDAMQRDLIVLALQRRKLQPVVCPQASQVEEMVSQHKPELLILNLLLHGCNGLDLLDGLRKKGKLDRTKVVLLSPLGFPEIVRKAARAGASAFMVKPLDPELLAERTCTLLRVP